MTSKFKRNATLTVEDIQTKFQTLIPRPKTLHEFAMSNFELFYEVMTKHRPLLSKLKLCTKSIDSKLNSCQEKSFYWAKILSVDDVIAVMKSNPNNPLEKFSQLRTYYSTYMTPEEQVKVRFAMPNTNWKALSTYEEIINHVRKKLPITSISKKKNLLLRLSFLKSANPKWYSEIRKFIETETVNLRKPQHCEDIKVVWSEDFVDEMIEFCRTAGFRKISEIKRTYRGRRFISMMEYRKRLAEVYEAIERTPILKNRTKTAAQYVESCLSRGVQPNYKRLSYKNSGYGKSFIQAVKILFSIHNGKEDFYDCSQFKFLWSSNTEILKQLFNQTNLGVENLDDLQRKFPSIARILDQRPFQKRGIFK